MVRPLAKTRRRFHGGARPHEKSYTELSLKFQPGPFISWLRGLLSPGVRGVYRGEPTWIHRCNDYLSNPETSYFELI